MQGISEYAMIEWILSQTNKNNIVVLRGGSHRVYSRWRCYSTLLYGGSFGRVLKPHGPWFEPGLANYVYQTLLANNFGSWCEDKHKRRLRGGFRANFGVSGGPGVCVFVCPSCGNTAPLACIIMLSTGALAALPGSCCFDKRLPLSANK